MIRVSRVVPNVHVGVKVGLAHCKTLCTSVDAIGLAIIEVVNDVVSAATWDEAYPLILKRVAVVGVDDRIV
jgi:hypothetical protein